MGTTKSSDILLSLNRHLDVWKVDHNTVVCVSYERSEVKDGPVLVGTYGKGRDFESACDDYLAQIRGKMLVFDACTDHRKEVTVLG